jgi:pimeloyl-ACP methyl ester carboxylesterase
VTRNGRARPRTITTEAGGIEIEAPRVDDKRVDAETGERYRFRSSIVPPWCRKSPKVAEVLPLMYLHGMSSGDFAPALSEFFGSSAGLSPSVITRLTTQWQAEQRAFAERRLDHSNYVYAWADGVHFNVRLAEDRLCALVIVGVRADGTKELIAIADGYRESTESWADVLRDLKRQGMRAPILAVGDGALGFWGGAARGVPRYPWSALLGPQGGQRPQRAAQVGTLVPTKLTRAVADAIPGARYLEISDCGHGGPWEVPDRINPVLVEFLAELPFPPATSPRPTRGGNNPQEAAAAPAIHNS